MDPMQLDALLKVLNKLVSIQDKVFAVDAAPSEVSHEHFRKQGAKEVLSVIEGIRDGRIDMKEYLK